MLEPGSRRDWATKSLSHKSPAVKVGAIRDALWEPEPEIRTVELREPSCKIQSPYLRVHGCRALWTRHADPDSLHPIILYILDLQQAVEFNQSVFVYNLIKLLVIRKLTRSAYPLLCIYFRSYRVAQYQNTCFSIYLSLIRHVASEVGAGGGQSPPPTHTPHFFLQYINLLTSSLLWI